MKIIVDAMGGDNAPFEIVKGSLEAAETLGVDIILTGKVEEAADEVLSIIKAAHCRTENRIHYLKEEL